MNRRTTMSSNLCTLPEDDEAVNTTTSAEVTTTPSPIEAEYDIIDRGIGLPKKVITEIEEEGSEGEAESEVRLRRHSKIIHKNTTRRYVRHSVEIKEFYVKSVSAQKKMTIFL